jgi:hypothetical protein
VLDEQAPAGQGVEDAAEPAALQTVRTPPEQVALPGVHAPQADADWQTPAAHTIGDSAVPVALQVYRAPAEHLVVDGAQTAIVKMPLHPKYTPASAVTQIR